MALVRNPSSTPSLARNERPLPHLGLELRRAEFLIEVKQAYTQFQVRLQAFECTLQAEPSLKGRNLRWVSLRGLRHYPFPSGSAKVVDFLEKQLRIGS
ncbi:MAG: hypothetical protein MUP19_01875 [Candidatus Aminicenantes bacterium]|nr:hypothetical protein [Candidatus Aminicenantes bacterium]